MSIAIVLTVLLVALVLFITEVLPIEVVAVLMLLALSFTGTLTLTEALSGFSDPAVLTIAGFFIISAGLFNTGVVEVIGHRLHKLSGSNKTLFLIMMLITAAALSAFISNVVTTAVLMPAVIGVARRMKQPLSQFLMPLAYGATLGSRCTLVGSPTNLAINGLLPKYNLQQFSLFEFAPLGITLVFAEIIYMLIIGVRLLPKGKEDEGEDEYRIKEYTTEVVLRPDSPLVNKTLTQTNFRSIYDLQILKIVRNDEETLPHGNTRLRANDTLIVQGKLEKILSIKDEQGLDIKRDRRPYERGDDFVIVEAILSPQSAFLGKTLKEIEFGSRYGADVIAIYRHHETLHEKLSEVTLEFGDVLVIQGDALSISKLRHEPNFLTLEDIQHTPFKKSRAAFAIVIFVIAGIAAAIKIAPLPLVAMAAAAAIFLTRCLTVQEAYDKVEWSVIIFVASAIPLGIAMDKTGAAKLLADYVTQYIGAGGPIIVMAAFFIFATLLTQPMSNVACGLLMTPIAIKVAEQLSVNPRAFAVVISIAASCAFTPLEPATALVYGPGKYRFSDYVKVGGLLTIVVMIVTLIVVPIFWPL